MHAVDVDVTFDKSSGFFAILNFSVFGNFSVEVKMSLISDGGRSGGVIICQHTCDLMPN